MDTNKEIIKELEQKAEKEYGKTLDLVEAIGDIRCNDDNIKVLGSVGFGAITWLLSMIAMPFIVGTGALPAEIIQPLFVVVPAGVGVGSSIALQKTLKNKERLSKRTAATTQVDRTVAATKLEVEKTKHKTRTNMFVETVTKLRSQHFTDSTVNDNKDERTKTEIEQSISNIENTINENLKEIDITTTKQTLKERFWKIRDKKQKLKDIIMVAILSGIIGFTIYNIPLIAMNGLNAYQVTPSLLQLLTPGIITSIAATGFAIKHKSDETKAFKRINKELLGENALPETIDDSEKETQVSKKQDKLNELVELSASLAQERAVKQNNYGEDNILFKDYESIKVTEETRQHVIDHPEMYQNCPPRIRQGMFYTDEEYASRVEDALSTPLPGEEEKGIAFTKKDKRK